MRIRHDKTGYELVLVPAGEFRMGRAGAGEGPEFPQHRVYLNAFWMGVTEVTNAQYRALSAKHRSPAGLDGDRQPVVQVSFDEARSWCMKAGMRLPTEAEWEKAARGTDGRLYAWGNTDDAKRRHWNSDENAAPCNKPVGSFPSGASPYGCLDISGNVWEWCWDWFGRNYYAKSPAKNPTGPSSSPDNGRVIRGGGAGGPVVTGRAYGPPDYKDNVTGFRAAVTPL